MVKKIIKSFGTALASSWFKRTGIQYWSSISVFHNYFFICSVFLVSIARHLFIPLMLHVLTSGGKHLNVTYLLFCMDFFEKMISNITIIIADLFVRMKLFFRKSDYDTMTVIKLFRLFKIVFVSFPVYCIR